MVWIGFVWLWIESVAGPCIFENNILGSKEGETRAECVSQSVPVGPPDACSAQCSEPVAMFLPVGQPLGEFRNRHGGYRRAVATYE
jgi:hypothetical protein